VPQPIAALLLAALVGATTPAAAATLFITNTKSDSVSVIDTDTLDVVGTIPVGRGKPNRIVFQPDGRAAWRATLLDAGERGLRGLLVPADPRLLDILRNPDDPGYRHDLQLAQG